MKLKEIRKLCEITELEALRTLATPEAAERQSQLDTKLVEARKEIERSETLGISKFLTFRQEIDQLTFVLQGFFEETKSSELAVRAQIELQLSKLSKVKDRLNSLEPWIATGFSRLREKISKSETVKHSGAAVFSKKFLDTFRDLIMLDSSWFRQT